MYLKNVNYQTYIFLFLGRSGKKYIEYHLEKYGFRAPKVTFVHGCIEKWGEAGTRSESYDVMM